MSNIEKLAAQKYSFMLIYKHLTWAASENSSKCLFSVKVSNNIIELNFSFLNNLCIGLDGDGNVVMKENDDGDNSQFWTWNDDNDSLMNKDGMALDVCGGDEDAGI